MEQKYTFSTLVQKARELLWIARKLHIDPERGVSLKQVEEAARGWREREQYCGQPLNTHWTVIRFIEVARSWLRFLGYWRTPKKVHSFELLVDAFRLWMEKDRGFTPATINQICGELHQFFHWYTECGHGISEVRFEDLDGFLASYGEKGNCRKSVKNMAAALRIFFKYAGSMGWCSSSIAPLIHGPRIFAQEQLPLGPSWEDVRRLIACMETCQANDIRDKPIVMLFSIYGFRAMEVATLKLEDIDWERNLISLARAKRRGRQTYPLIPSVGNAIIRYIKEVRPSSSYREIFLRLVAPFKPISRGALYALTSKRMRALGINTCHSGPHSLRHACATHLVAEGFSLKEIGDHLGHRCSSATRIYAKVDLAGLREVAAFDLGGLL
jgi:site-specific recombinase XerD